MPEKLVVLSFVAIAILSIFLLARNAFTLSFNLPNPQQALDFITNLVPMDSTWQTPPPSPQVSPSPSSVPSSPISVPSVIPTPIRTRACFRFTVPNSSTKCYTQVDYNQLTNLGYQYSSAATFYQFHLDGATRYQSEYEKTGSSIYLDAKASQESKASEQKQTMDDLIRQMQAIESRSWQP